MNPMVIVLRSIARKAGVIRLIHRLRPPRSHEEHFRRALTEAVRPGDTVWDVGANEGIYTELFSEWVGPGGLVVAFEPDIRTCANIQKLSGYSRRRTENIALGDQDTTGNLVVGTSSWGNYIHTCDSPHSAVSNLVPVTINRGDSVAKRLGHIPNVVKIDVEGFEEEVLHGMDEMLLAPALRAVLVEVHFRTLEQRGRRAAPVRIEKLLQRKGFETRWVDASHLVARR